MVDKTCLCWKLFDMGVYNFCVCVDCTTVWVLRLWHKGCDIHSRAGLVWIFQLQFDSVHFSISSTWFHFFGFGICTSSQCKSILVCENTKTDSIYFDGNSFTLCMYRWAESSGCCPQLPSVIYCQLKLCTLNSKDVERGCANRLPSMQFEQRGCCGL